MPRVGHIRHFAIHPSWIGQGVGRSIYSMCEEQARIAGMQRFECYANLNAEGFYAALGFRPVRRIEITMGPRARLPGVLMERSI
jgi:N-acetylglutamate synthase-like GNAT family acetyltransferase